MDQGALVRAASARAGARRVVTVGLRGQILAALLLVTLGAVASIGALTTWQTRQVLAADRVERAANLTDTGRRLAEAALGPAASLDDRRETLAGLAADVARALDAEEVAFFDEHGAAVAPAGAPALPTDERGLAAARAGAPPHAEERPGEPDRDAARLVAYAALRSGDRPLGVLRATFALDRAVEATLERSRTTLWILGGLDGLVLLVAASWILRQAVVRPVADLERAAGKVAAGDLEARVEVRGPGELGRLADAFDRMTDSLRTGRESLIRSEKLAGLGRLAAGVAHEVGNPLAAVLGYVETLLTDTPDRPIDPALRTDILERVRGETQRIHRIIGELLEYARAPADEPEAVDVAKAVDAALSLARASARLRGVTAEVALPAGLPAARATTGRVTQVLLNLVVNAADAMGGAGALVIDGRSAGGRVIVAVSDQGPGVPAEHRAKIFDPFFTTKDPGAGTGLGLAVSLAIAESFGGTLRLATAARGARFELELPAAA